jgi:hypothetical protein
MLLRERLSMTVMVIPMVGAGRRSCVMLGIDGGEQFVHGEEVFFKLSVGVGELFVHGVELFVHGGAPCFEVFEPRVFRFTIPGHGHKARSIRWKVRWLEKLQLEHFP